MARDSQDSAPMSRFRAFTTSLGFKPSGGMSRSSSDQSSAPERRASMTSLRPLYGNFTLYLRVHSARNLPAVAQGSYCKLYLGDTPMIGGFGQGKSLVGADKRNGNSHQTFHTKVQMSATRDCPEWNEKFQMNVKNPNTEILTIRVKNHVLIYSPAIGACVVHLRQLQLGETLDEWFPLYRNDKPSGEIRLQICMQENAAIQIPERKYSQPSEETIQRLMQEHRELEEAQRRELELQQQEKWKRMEEDAVKHVGLEQQIEREEKWREQNARRIDPVQQEDTQEKELAGHFKKEEDSDSDLPASFKYRGVKKEEKVILKQEKEEDKREEVDFGIPSGYTIDRADSGNSYPSELSGFGTIRLSVEELKQVVNNALPTSESSDSTDSERERRRRKDKKRRHRKKYSKRRVDSDESSDDSSYSSRYRKGSSKTKGSEGDSYKKRSIQGSVSSRSETSAQNQQPPEIPTTLTYPRSHSAVSSSSEDSEDERRRRRRRRAERARRREKERKRRSRRKHKGRRNYESSYSSSSLSSSSLSSSEEERLARKFKKKEKARSKLVESGDSRASTQSSGMHQPSYANSRTIDSMSPYVAQQWKPERIDVVQVSEPQEGRDSYVQYTTPATSFVPSSALQPVQNNYGPDGVGFDEPDEPSATPQYLGQTTKEQTNAELMRSFCF